ncbi:hypothetical protein QBC35DRAFT_58000 [Podospora australis]|uniref:NACHT domain-containing protein n=1 Tax=Podospora australis TaxID=1536484 RepID=A0AAN6WM27_9PEZI|nr:hypothetical protein QBC35DRAFT_58000 [Podospora australis]
MEALGVAASIIAVVQISSQVISLCAKYIESVEDAPKDLRHILIEVSALKGLFEPLKILVGFDTETAVLEAQLSAPVDGCLNVVQQLDALIRLPATICDDDQPRGKRRRLANLKIQLAWPLKQERAKRLLDLLSVYKSTINLLLSSHGISQLQRISQDMRAFRSDLDEVARAKILNWVVTVNPSINHNQALDLHQDGTCEWVSDSEEWRQWTKGVIHNSGPRGMWVYGIPGSGKTILASFLTMKMKVILGDSPQVAMVYYYCHHARNHDELPHFLRWLLGQICRRAEYIPEPLRHWYEADLQPQLDDLVGALKMMVPRFEKILVLIDAVDESQKRERLAEFLNQLATSNEYSPFHIVVTSRKEVDIERHIGQFICLSMSNSLVDRDIDTYIQGQLDTDRALKRWSEGLRSHVRETLVSKANGMFRLVVCQLQILKKVPLESGVKKALQQLPETLDETYERILSSIPSECTHIVWRALCLLGTISMVPIRPLRSFVSTDDSDDETMEDEIDEEVFLEIMGSLLILTEPADDKPHEGRLVRLAHYTVKEYLESTRAAHSPTASTFFLPSSRAIGYSFRIVLRTLSTEPPQSSASWRIFRQYCKKHWDDVLQLADPVIAGDPSLSQLTFMAMDPRSPNYYRLIPKDSAWKELGSKRYAFVDEFPHRPDVAVLINLIRKNLYATTAAFLLQYSPRQLADLCTFEAEGMEKRPLVGWLARDHHDKYLLLLLDRAGSEFHYDRACLLVWAMELYNDYGVSETLSTLLSAKVPVNPSNTRITPLQIAVRRIRAADVRILLEEGADPNAVGERNGWAPSRLFGMTDGGQSPLFIIRGIKNGAIPGKGWIDAQHTHRQIVVIEELLVKAGGREFCKWGGPETNVPAIPEVPVAFEEEID